MGSVRFLALAAAAAGAITSGAANAADFPLPPPPPPPHVIEEFSGWYLRGDIGMTNQRVGDLDNALFATTPALRIVDTNFESGMLFGVGVGYKFNSWLRFDVTGEYRGETGFHGLDLWNDGTARFNNYTAKKSELLFLANVYADLGTWHGVTPFVGAGVGFARVGIHSFRDAGIDPVGNVTLGYADSDYKWNFAWALHAGVAYEVTKNFTIELAYRYVSLGDGQSGDIISFDGTNAIVNPMHFRDLDSHDLKLGVRWMFASGYDFAPPPLIRKF